MTALSGKRDQPFLARLAAEHPEVAPDAVYVRLAEPQLGWSVETFFTALADVRGALARPRGEPVAGVAGGPSRAARPRGGGCGDRAG
jgi:hypothetical protein